MKLRLLLPVLLAMLAVVFSTLYYHGAFGPHLFLIKTSFQRLPHWKQDNQSLALRSFQQSCSVILKRDPNAAFSTHPESGYVRDWQTICLAANKLNPADTLAARQFFETWFLPYHVVNNFNSRGLFTGYYLPLLHGSLTQEKDYSIPIYALPTDLVKINLGQFSRELVGKIIIGRLNQQTLLPYPDRAAISQGALQNARVLAWGNNLLDLYFAQIQGSALLELPNHQQYLLSYAGTNGQPYTAIGKILIANHALTKKTVSMQSIRAWLLQHPDQLNSILNRNASYVFFTLQKATAPLGTEKVFLTPERSLAVDTHTIPLGAPLWLDTSVPQHAANQSRAFQQLVIAQDTGGAINGIVRGDIYWGAGNDAEFYAGHMKSAGQYWMLLPRISPTKMLT